MIQKVNKITANDHFLVVNFDNNVLLFNKPLNFFFSKTKIVKNFNYSGGISTKITFAFY